MKKDDKNLKKRTGSLWLRIVVVFAVSLAIFAVTFVWRLGAAPISINYAKSYIEQSLVDSGTGMHASLGNVVLHWPGYTGPILLGVEGVEVINEAGDVIVSISEAGLVLSTGALLIGHVSPVALILREPSLRLIRTENGGFDVGFGESLEDVAVFTEEDFDQQTKIMEDILNYIAEPDNSDETSPLANLEAFDIIDARVVVEDRLLNESWNLPNVDINIQSAKEGLSGRFHVDFPEGENGPSSIQAKFLVFSDTKRVQAQAALNNVDFKKIAQTFPDLAAFSDQNILMNAEVGGVFDANLKPLSARMYVSSEKGVINIPDIYEDPLVYEDMYLDLLYEDNEMDPVLEVVGVGVKARGVSVKATTNLDIDRTIIQGPVRIEIDNIAHEQIQPLWPKPLENDRSAEWILQKLGKATLSDVYAQANIEFLQKKYEKNGDVWRFDFSDLIAGFKFQGMTANYRDPLKPVVNADGSGSFVYDTATLDVKITSGKIGDLDIENGNIKFKDIIIKDAGVAHIEAKLKGLLSGVFYYVQDEPLNQTQEFDIAQIGGEADLDIVLDFPLRKGILKEEVKTEIAGKLTGVSIPDVVKDLDFSGGNLDLKVKDIGYELSGSGQLEGKDISLSYKGFVNSDGKKYHRKIKADFISNNDMRDRFGFDVQDFLDGDIGISLDHTEYNDGTSEARVKLDLTPGRLLVEPFNYEKPIGKQGVAGLTALMKDGSVTEIKNLMASAPSFQLEDTFLKFKQQNGDSKLSMGKLSRLVLGETIVKVDFEVEEPERFKIIVNGPFLDLRSFLNIEKGKQEKDRSAMLLSVNADAMRTADGETIQYGKLYIDIDDQGRFNQLEMDGVVGNGDIYLRYKPDEEGKRIFRFEADDAGATLRAFGLYDKVVGGKMVIYGEPIRSIYDRNLIGAAEITDFKVVNAPSLAKLLSALSLQGMQSLLGNEGLFFSKLKADFDWLYRPSGSLIVLKKGRTSGNSLGLTFEGLVDNADGNIDLSGTIVPLSGVNKVISKIPLVGDILTGGSGGVFAATYTIKGETKEPEIKVNPLAVLAPGILRRILFE